ncbi:response regulator transcription factor [Variovorax saccharolyticus]|uniref:response regulator transcription factor n=1 Tax=Variovorax saccharolyticus TaxID=3053516 RepID=UPI0025765FC0|nr:response regulator [Variovorax sp. J22R187]MDM0019382.1 response regulator [Variovorax sp. J22R187]
MHAIDPLIAVVDDESPMRTMLGRVLRLADYRVSSFASGEEFLASLDTQRPACVILDIHMPGLSGFEVQMRMQAADIRVPVVFITASDDAALARLAAEAKASCLLRKPFSSDELLEAIRRHGSDLTKG